VNIVDATIVKILSDPELKYEKWFVEVEIDLWGSLSKTSAMFSSEDTARNLKVGDSIKV